MKITLKLTLKIKRKKNQALTDDSNRDTLWRQDDTTTDVAEKVVGNGEYKKDEWLGGWPESDKKQQIGFGGTA